jgi:hypothetical protein
MEDYGLRIKDQEGRSDYKDEHCRMEDYGLRIKKGEGGMRPRGADAPWAQKIVDGIWKMGLSRTKPLGSGAVDYRR